MNKNNNTIIESLGVALPPNSASTSEIMAGCKQQPFNFPLERVSGIKSRHVGGEGYFSIDLAKQAVTDCLKLSKYNPSDIDLIICCNISRVDGPDRFSFEPSTAVRLKKYFGLEHALTFDVSNACAGMFTGVYLADAFLKAGSIDRALICSGEYITHLATTAQREIEGFMDARIACLTLGDAGAAVILERGTDPEIGFKQLNLQTYGRYSPLCIGRVAETGGWVMHTDAVNLAEVAIKAGSKYALDQLSQAGWSPESIDHLILHQTSRTTINGAQHEISSLLNRNVFDKVNLVDNLENRGNTASTSHFVAIADQIRNQKLKSGDKAMFSISASGLTVGVGLFTYDDLPDRLLQMTDKELSSEEKMTRENRSAPSPRREAPRVQVDSIGIIAQSTSGERDTRELLQRAMKNCLTNSSHQAQEIEILIYCGVYRTGYVLEPAYATLLAGDLDLNSTPGGLSKGQTFAFDIFNGSVGFLNACHVAQQLLAAGKCKTIMVVTAETENNREDFPDELLGIRETASAIILHADPDSTKGFSRFLFQSHIKSSEAYITYCDTSTVQPRLQITRDDDLERQYLKYICKDVQELLTAEELELTQIDWVFPPQISSHFIAQLSHSLNLPSGQFIDVSEPGSDLFSSSFPYALEEARKTGLIKAGDIGLVIMAGSGIQVGCAIYHF
jgi:3-oxoacyl-[acyl-carrier-protein] synthase III